LLWEQRSWALYLTSLIGFVGYVGFIGYVLTVISYLLLVIGGTEGPVIGYLLLDKEFLNANQDAAFLR